MLAFVLVLTTMLTVACGGGGGGAGSTGGNGGGAGDGSGDGTEQQSSCLGQSCGLLEPGKQLVDRIGSELSDRLPGRLGEVVGCGSDVLVNLIDVPDSFLGGLVQGLTQQDLSVVRGVVSNVGQSVGNMVQNLYGMLGAVIGREDECAIDGGDIHVPILSDIVAEGPTGTALDMLLNPLIRALNLFIGSGALDEEGLSGVLMKPVRIAAAAILAIIDGESPFDLDLGLFDIADNENPMRNALVKLKAAIDAGKEQLGLLTDGEPQGELSLQPLARVTGAVQEVLAVALAHAETVVEENAGSEVPVIGGLLTTLQTGLVDSFNVMDAIANADREELDAGLEALLENGYSNLLVEVLPLGVVGDEFGLDVIGAIQAGISDALSVVVDGEGLQLGEVLMSFFDNNSDDQSRIERLVSRLLALRQLDLRTVLVGGVDQLFDSVSRLVALPGEVIDRGVGFFDDLLGGLSAEDDSEGVTDERARTPLGLLFGALADADPTGTLDRLLGAAQSAVDFAFNLLNGLLGRS